MLKDNNQQLQGRQLGRRLAGVGWALLILNSMMVLVSSFSSSSYYSQSTSTLERLAYASSLSYLSLQDNYQMITSPYYPISQLTPIDQVVDPITESGATVFLDESDDGDDKNRLIIACRGSANIQNFATNLRFQLVPATKLSQPSIPDNALIHEGFQEASDGLWKQVGQQIMDILQKDTRIIDIVFTGHSLGAANALLCAVHFAAAVGEDTTIMKKKFDSKPAVITFAGPRLCNDVLAHYIGNHCLEGSEILNIVHDKDPVLANNQQLWDQLGFEIVGKELQCDPNSPVVYDTDGEKDKQQSFMGNLFNNKPIAWNILDHCDYMGVFVGPRI